LRQANEKETSAKSHKENCDKAVKESKEEAEQERVKQEKEDKIPAVKHNDDIEHDKSGIKPDDKGIKTYYPAPGE
jgi:hypothetical protein